MPYRARDEQPQDVPYWCFNCEAWFLFHVSADEYVRPPVMRRGECDHAHEIRLIPDGSR